MVDVRECDIPDIGDLKKELGYGIPKHPKSKIFNKILSDFRSQYKTASGQTAYQLTRRTDQTVMRDLGRMADDFLEGEGGGQKFWGDQEGLKYRWSQKGDRGEIKKRLVNLFWRSNVRNRPRKNRPRRHRPRRNPRMNAKGPAKGPTGSNSDSNSHSHNPTTREEHLDIDFDQYIEDDDDHDEPSRDDDVAEHQYSVPSSPRGPPQGDAMEAGPSSQNTERPRTSFPSPCESISMPRAPVAPMSIERSPTIGRSFPEKTFPATCPRRMSQRRRVRTRPGLTTCEQIGLMCNGPMGSPDLGTTPDSELGMDTQEGEDGTVPLQSTEQVPSMQQNNGPSLRAENYNADQAPGGMMPPPPRPLQTNMPQQHLRSEPDIWFFLQVGPNNYEIWDDDKRFKTMTMHQFEQELNLQGKKKIRFIIKGLGFRRHAFYHQGNEAGFRHLKFTLWNLMQDTLNVDPNAVNFDVEIEPIPLEEPVANRCYRELTMPI